MELIPDTHNFFTTDAIAEDLRVDDTVDKGSFNGIAAYYNKYNRNDRCYKPGCFDKSLKSSKIMMLWNHSSTAVVGRWNDIYSEGMKIKANGQLILTTGAGNDAYELIKNDAISGLSIGWVPYFNGRTKG
jgi:HK97 family phage prohead protease